jgi:hypothetical protein
MLNMSDSVFWDNLTSNRSTHRPEEINQRVNMKPSNDEQSISDRVKTLLAARGVGELLISRLTLNPIHKMALVCNLIRSHCTMVI